MINIHSCDNINFCFLLSGYMQVGYGSCASKSTLFFKKKHPDSDQE